MLPTARWTPVLGLLLALEACGCVTSGKPKDQEVTSIWPTVSTDDSNRTPKPLRDPTSVHVAYGKWQESGGMTAEARESYEAALDKNPKSVDALLGLSRLDLLAGREEESAERLAKAEKLAPRDTQVLQARSQQLGRQGRWDEAADKLRLAVEGNPNDPALRSSLAIALAWSGDLDGALQEFRLCVGPAEAHYNVGHFLYGQKKYAEAEAQFRKALALRPDLEQANEMLALIEGASGSRPAASVAGGHTSVPEADAPQKIQQTGGTRPARRS